MGYGTFVVIGEPKERRRDILFEAIGGVKHTVFDKPVHAEFWCIQGRMGCQILKTRSVG